MMIGVTFSEDTFSFRCFYTNWRGERSLRHIRPEKIYFGATDWHPVEQWLMQAWDIGNKVRRVFAMKDMERAPLSEDCPDCARQIMKRPEAGSGFLAKCGRRLIDIEECQASCACTILEKKS